MESPPPTKKSKLEENVQVETSEIRLISTDPGDTISQTSVRQQLHDLLSEASARSCGTPLPIEVTDAFDDKKYELIELVEYVGEDVDMFDTPLHKNQLMAIVISLISL